MLEAPKLRNEQLNKIQPLPDLGACQDQLVAETRSAILVSLGSFIWHLDSKNPVRELLDKAAIRLADYWLNISYHGFQYEDWVQVCQLQAILLRAYALTCSNAFNVVSGDYLSEAECYLSFLFTSRVLEEGTPSTGLAWEQLRLLVQTSVEDIRRYRAYFTYLSRTHGQPDVGDSKHLEDYFSACKSVDDLLIPKIKNSSN
jgi:hypothetical protein